jgi:NAD(P)-dependent dehydrogenase (short-subunit alcohol dehydrogenase family)
LNIHALKFTFKNSKMWGFCNPLERNRYMAITFDFKDKVALVTGGASGIGEACVLTFGRAGAKVLIADLNVELGEKTANTIRQEGGEALFVQVDVTDPVAVEQMVEVAMQSFGRLNIAVNNAGIGPESKPVGQHSLEGWHRVINVNLNAVFYCMHYEIPHMLEQTGGVIVNMSSIMGTVAGPNGAAYVAAKHGVVGLTKSAALDYGKYGLRINAVGPGFIKTPLMGPSFNEQTEAYLGGLHPIGRMGEPQEVADLVAYLCSEQASFMTGGYYLVDGGYTAQ